MTAFKHRPNWVAAVAAVAVVTLTACQDRGPTVPPSPASSGEYPSPAVDAPTPSAAPVAVPGTGADVTAKGPQTGMVGGATGTVGSGGKPGSGSASGAGTGAAASSDSKVDTKK